MTQQSETLDRIRTSEPLSFPARQPQSPARQVNLDDVSLDDKAWKGLQPAICEIAKAAVAELVSNTVEETLEKGIRKERRAEADRLRSLGDAQAALSAQLGLLHDRLEKEVANLRQELQALNARTNADSASRTADGAPERTPQASITDVVADVKQRQHEFELQLKSQVAQLGSDTKKQLGREMYEMNKFMQERFSELDDRLSQVSQGYQSMMACSQQHESNPWQTGSQHEGLVGSGTGSINSVGDRSLVAVLPGHSFDLSGASAAIASNEHLHHGLSAEFRGLNEEIRRVGDRCEMQARELAVSLRSSIIGELAQAIDNLGNRDARGGWSNFNVQTGDAGSSSAAHSLADQHYFPAAQSVPASHPFPVAQSQHSWQDQQNVYAFPSGTEQWAQMQMMGDRHLALAQDAAQFGDDKRRCSTPGPDKDSFDVSISGQDLHRGSHEQCVGDNRYYAQPSPGSTLTPRSVTPALNGALDYSIASTPATLADRPAGKHTRPASATASAPSRPRPQATQHNPRLPYQNGPPAFDSADQGSGTAVPRRPQSAHVHRTRPMSATYRSSARAKQQEYHSVDEPADVTNSQAGRPRSRTQNLREEIHAIRFTDPSSFCGGHY